MGEACWPARSRGRHHAETELVSRGFLGVLIGSAGGGFRLLLVRLLDVVRCRLVPLGRAGAVRIVLVVVVQRDASSAALWGVFHGPALCIGGSVLRPQGVTGGCQRLWEL